VRGLAVRLEILIISRTKVFLKNAGYTGASKKLFRESAEMTCQGWMIALALRTTSRSIQDVARPELTAFHLPHNAAYPIETERALKEKGLDAFLPLFDSLRQTALLL
jgi:hypothetical protein